MKQTPIPFSAPMIRAIMTCAHCGKISVPFPCEHCGSTEFVKTQTRIVIRWAPRPDCVMCNGKGYEFIDCGSELSDYDYSEPCRCITDKCRYREGVMLWSKEAWRVGMWREEDGQILVDYRADGYSSKVWVDIPDEDQFNRLWEQSCADAAKVYGQQERYLWKPGQSPCRWRPSIFMPKEACRLWLIITGTRDQEVQDISEEDCLAEGIRLPPTELFPDINTEDKLRQQYAWLWDKLYAKRGYAWKWNPWCQAISFQRTNKENT
jgi:hypothetical protein